MPGPLGPTELQEILAFTTELSRKAGALILEGSHAIQRAGTGSVGEKKNAVDLVTEYDVKVEELVRREIAGAYPHFQFIGEESYSAGTRPPLTDAPTFCVDPIDTQSLYARRTADGTTNFVHGFPYACISLGLIDQRAQVLGVIYNPFLDHLYTGVRGASSFLHTHTQPQPQRLPLAPAAARPLPSLGGALIAVEWGSDRAQEPIRAKAQSFSRLAGAPPNGVMAHSLRSVGSAALNFALVAQGALDAYWEIGCWHVPSYSSLFLGCMLNIDCWSCLQAVGRMRAGIVIAQEAGGFVTGSKAAPHDGVVTEVILTGRRYLVIRGVAGTPTLWSELSSNSEALTVVALDMVSKYEMHFYYHYYHGVGDLQLMWRSDLESNPFPIPATGTCFFKIPTETAHGIFSTKLNKIIALMKASGLHYSALTTARFSTVEDGKEPTLSHVTVWIAVRPNTAKPRDVCDVTPDILQILTK
ncbi:hypothetical protein H4582DRAFT_2084105 [Lactarius indigo]|nr:hypothetical protein H4582DRAFT_2084105 [Lactarius indigo]